MATRLPRNKKQRKLVKISILSGCLDGSRGPRAQRQFFEYRIPRKSIDAVKICRRHRLLFGRRCTDRSRGSPHSPQRPHIQSTGLHHQHVPELRSKSECGQSLWLLHRLPILRRPVHLPALRPRSPGVAHLQSHLSSDIGLWSYPANERCR